ncbi:hypothetical protein TYRP_023570 [Tyrophagus putrescentiae]|nr:hypothetical protein TYRP_023570 [Tyrophagus putrescentiae]
MSSADIPPFVFAFKMLILFIAVVTFFMAGKFLAGLFHSATINKAEEKAKWNEKKRRQANRKARKRAAEAEETLATAATALQLVEEMVEQVDKDQGKPTSGFNILEMAKRKRKQAVEQVVEVKVEVEKELFSDADDDDEEGEVDSDTVATTPISVTSDTSAAVVAASFSSSSSSADEVPTAYAEAVADKVDKVKDIPSKTLKTPVENTLSSSSFVAITFSPPSSPRPPSFSSLMIPLQDLSSSSSSAQEVAISVGEAEEKLQEALPATSSSPPSSPKKQEVFSVA